jgi:transposase
MTVAPCALANCSAKIETPPVPCNKTVSPACSLPYFKPVYGQETRLIIIWDRAIYHRSAVVQQFLQQLNGGLSAQEWKITCIRLAPNAPEQNPVEDVWLQAKQFLRKYARLCKSFGSVKFLFQLVTHCQIFAFPKAFMYGYCSSPIWISCI